MELSDCTVNDVDGTEPNHTAVARLRPAPEIVTAVPPADSPDEVLSPPTMGLAGA
jgi:hypothetical protein